MTHNIFKPRAVRLVENRIRWLSEEDNTAFVNVWKRVGSEHFKAVDVDDIYPGFKNSTRHLKFNKVIINQGRGIWQISDTIRARFEKSYGADSV